MTDSTPLTPAEREQLAKLAQELHRGAVVPICWSEQALLARALYELARLQTMDKAREEGEDGSDPNS